MIQNPRSKSSAQRLPPKAFVFNPKLVVVGGPGRGAGWLWGHHSHPDITTRDDPAQPAPGDRCAGVCGSDSLAAPLSCLGAGRAGGHCVTWGRVLSCCETQFPVTHCGPPSSVCSRRQARPPRANRWSGAARGLGVGWLCPVSGEASPPGPARAAEAGEGPRTRTPAPRTHAVKTMIPQVFAHPSPSRNRRTVVTGGAALGRAPLAPHPGPTAGPGGPTAPGAGPAGGPRTHRGTRSERPPGFPAPSAARS